MNTDPLGAGTHPTGRTGAAPTDAVRPDDFVQSTCHICGHSGLQATYMAKEMMFGTGEPFQYFQCGACGCLQIRDIPENLADHYPGDYYSLSVDHAQFYANPVKNWLNRLRDQQALFAPWGDRLPLMVAFASIAGPYRALRHLGTRLSLKSRLLDVGCGSGQLLFRLRNAGFTRLTGADPFLAESKRVDETLRFLKCTLAEVDEQFDILMMNHSFEHVPDPVEMFALISARLAPDGAAIVRIPLADSAAWDEYGVNWFQLDAPRHLHLHTKRSMEHMARKAGLRISEVVHDSLPDQFVISEGYRRGLPLVRKPSDPNAVQGFDLTAEQLKVFEARTLQVNAEGRGDQAAFYLVKA